MDKVRSLGDVAGSAVVYFVRTPQVHVHYLTTDAEADALGASHLVVVCHGCGQSIRVLFKLPADPQEGGLPTLTRVRDEFAIKHRGCPNRGFDRLCPPLDKGKQTLVDLRGQNLFQG